MLRTVDEEFRCAGDNASDVHMSGSIDETHVAAVRTRPDHVPRRAPHLFELKAQCVRLPTWSQVSTSRLPPYF